MRRFRGSARVWLGLAASSLGIGSTSTEALAQFPVASGPPMVVASPMVTSATPVTVDRGISYALPPFSQSRRSARTANRYTVARPVYAGRPGVTFAPYSDYYFPRVIGARETVYTASPGAPAPVGYRAFARPNAYPVFPR